MPDPMTPFASLPNLRDVGGHPTRDGGRVRPGQLFRSTDLSHLDETSARTVSELGLRTVFDLRTELERAVNPDRVPEGTAYVILDVLGDAPGSGPEALRAMFEDPQAARQVLGGGRADVFFEDRYREFVRLPSAQAAYGGLFRSILEADRRPALFHCSTGKDRTGWAAAVLLLWLDVPEDLVMAEYLESNDQVLPVFGPWLDAFVARGGERELLVPLLEVRPAYLQAGLDEMIRAFGSLQGYLADGLGLDAPARRGLRAALVERG